MGVEYDLFREVPVSREIPGCFRFQNYWARVMGSEFRKMLVELAKGIKDQELQSMKFLVGDQITKRRLGECKTVYDFWQALEQKELVSPLDVSYLKMIVMHALTDRNDLLRVVTSYESKCCVQEGSVTSSTTSAPAEQSTEAGLADEIEYVSSEIGKDWKQLARKMKLGERVISSIVERHHGDLKEQATAMLSTWLKQQTDGTAAATVALGELIGYLRVVGRNDIADDLVHRRHLASSQAT